MARYSVGLDFGTSAVRCVVVDLDSAAEVGVGSHAYRRGEHGVVLDAADPNLARQWPGDYRHGLRASLGAALGAARRAVGLTPEQVVGIGVDTTGSTPLPVDAHGVPLAERAEFAAEPAAMAWLWKDHTAAAEAEEITALAGRMRPEYLARCGGTYSSEWFWAKVLRCARTAPSVFEAAHSFVELCDHVPGLLVGAAAPEQLRRSVCAAGHKAMYAEDWGGLPDEEFLAALDDRLVGLRRRLYERAFTADQRAGGLAAGLAGELGLAPGTPVAVGAFDAHLGAVGAGIRPGELVKVMGTSTCDMAVAPLTELPPIDGLCGIVRGSILPDHAGFEAGQSAVGDIFEWCAAHLGGDHATLSQGAAALRAGESGLLALDWHNGNRCVLVDPALSGAVLGLSLATTGAELYRAYIEATAFGARVIADRLVAHGVAVDAVVACGGIAAKSDLVLQIYADVLNRRVEVCGSQETCALGAAIMAAVAGGAFADVGAAQHALVPKRDRAFAPRADEAAVYDRLFDCYLRIHDAFGGVGHPDLGAVMKRLLEERRRARCGRGRAET